MMFRKKASESSKAAEIVRDFYDTFGWKKDGASGWHLGEILDEDLSETAQWYGARSELRYKQYVEGGHFFLDAGCGGEPRRNLSLDFEDHVCVDISLTGLRSAREQLGTIGSYVKADLAALPFKDASFDGTLASHCLYHVDRDLQQVVLRELYRVTGKNKNILVFYSSRYNLISVLHRLPKAGLAVANPVLKVLSRIKRRNGTHGSPVPPLYAYAHNPLRLASMFKDVDVSCLSSLTKYDTKVLGKLRLLGPTLRILDFLERTFPNAMVYFGKYACIRILKTD